MLLVTPATKQAAARLLANSEEPAQYALMAVLAYLAVRHEIDHLSSITLDRDYSGEIAERIIVRRLLALLKRDRPRLKSSAVRVGNVANSKADRLARAAYKAGMVPIGTKLPRPSGARGVQREAEGGWRDHVGGDHGAAVRQKK